MNPVDNEILEVLYEEEGGTRAYIADEVDRAPNYVGDRLKVLLEHRLVSKPSRGYYRINDRGRSYLSGEMTKSELDADG